MLGLLIEESGSCSLAVVRGLLTVGASLGVEQTLGLAGFHGCAHGLSICFSRALKLGLSNCGLSGSESCGIFPD